MDDLKNESIIEPCASDAEQPSAIRRESSDDQPSARAHSFDTSGGDLRDREPPDDAFDMLLADVARMPTIGLGSTPEPTCDLFTADSRFECLGELGEGSFGRVYHALDRETQTRVALKTLHLMRPQALYRFKREFRSLCDLAHPNLVSLYELYSKDAQWFFTMEVVHGTDFTNYVRPGGVFDQTRLRHALGQLVLALIALHAEGKLHRDIKPSNVLVTAEGRVVVLDFGLVTELAGDAQSLDLAGTPAYMAPEQGLAAPVDEGADWYAVGVMLYEALTGELPFEERRDFREILVAKAKPGPTPPSALGAGLPATLVTLCEALLQLDPSERPRGEAILAQLGVMPPGAARGRTVEKVEVFVGRAAELATLHRAFEHSCEHACVVYVHGEGGIGKSALVRRFLSDLRMQAPDAVLIRGRCYDRETLPFKAVDSLVDDLSRWLLSLPKHAVRAFMPRDVAALARLFPALRRVDAIAEARQRGTRILEGAALRRQAFGALRVLLGRIALQRPVVLVIDDLQWGDADSAQLLMECLRPPQAPPILFVGTYRNTREGNESPLLRELDRGMLLPTDHLVKIALQPLSRDEAWALACAWLPDVVDMQQAPGWLLEAQGHPLLIEQMARALASGETQATECSLSRTLSTRFEALTPEAQAVMECVLIAGYPVETTLAAKSAGCLTALPRVLRELTQMRMVAVLDAAQKHERLVVYHDRIRETMLASRHPEAVRAHHRALADTLKGDRDRERQFNASAERLVYHLTEAGDPERAVPYARQAAVDARKATAFARACDLFAFALEHGRFATEEDAALRIELADVLSAAGYCDKASRVYLHLAQRLEGVRSKQMRVRAVEQQIASWEHHESIVLLGEMRASVGLNDTASGGLAQLLWQRLVVRARGLRFQARRDLPAQVEVVLDACFASYLGMLILDPMLALRFHHEHLRLALRSGSVVHVVRALLGEITYLATFGPRNNRRVDRLWSTLDHLHNDTTLPEDLELYITSVRGTTLMGRGEFQQALKLFVQADPCFNGTSQRETWWLGHNRISILSVGVFLGDARAIEAHLTALQQRLSAVEGRQWRALFSNFSLYFGPAMASDDLAAIDTAATIAIEQTGIDFKSPVHRWWWLSILTTADLYIGRMECACDRLESSWRAVYSGLRFTFYYKIELWSLRGRCALGAGRFRTARKAARRLASCDHDWALGFAKAFEAAILQTEHRAHDAAQRYDAAARHFDANHMALHAAVCRLRSAQARPEDEALREAREVISALGYANVDRIANMIVPAVNSAPALSGPPKRDIALQGTIDIR